MDETRKAKQDSSEFSRDKEKVVVAGLGAMTGASAVAAAVYSHEMSENGNAEITEAGVETSHSEDNHLHVSAGISGDEVEVISVESHEEVMDAAAENVILVAEVHPGQEVFSACNEQLELVDADGNQLPYGSDILSSDEQIMQDLQENGAWNEIPAMLQPDTMESPEGDSCFYDDNLYMA